VNKKIKIPIGSWFTEIDGWYRVRIRTEDCSNEEIGCGNSKEQAAKEAWVWWECNHHG